MNRLLPKSRLLARHFTLLILLILFLCPSSTNACVDYHPIPPRTTAKIDSTYTYIELRVHNLELFDSSSNGAFCTCALSHYTDLFSNVYYADFVTSGTDVSLAAFDPWSPSMDADTAWSAVMPGTGWDSFVALMVDSASNVGDSVDLLIRATLPPGLDSAAVAAALDSLYFGTDEWDPTRVGNLAFTHNSISPTQFQMLEIISADYFLGVPDDPLEDLLVALYPNPFSHTTGFYLKSRYVIPPDLMLIVYDINGALVRKERIQDHIHYFEKDDLSNGLYLYRIGTANQVIDTGRMVIQ